MDGSDPMRNLIIVALLALLNSGCASFNSFDTVQQRQFDQRVPVQFVRGQPRPVVDGLGRILGIPNRIALLDPRVDNHNVSQQTETELTHFMMQSGLNEVLVRVNQYDPLGEWRRLAANKRVRPAWKYTVGTYDTLKYTLLPGRLVGGDWYNPWTDTLNIYSDVPELAISEAAYAADVRTRLNPGAYSTLKGIPIVGLSHETRSTNATLEYYESTGDRRRYEEARQILIPNYGADWGGQLASFLPYGNVLGRIAGGLTGRAFEAGTNALGTRR